MQPVIDTVSKLTPSPPSGGSGVPNNPCFDLSKLDVAQQKAAKLKATLLEIQQLSDNIATILADQIAQLVIQLVTKEMRCSDYD